MSRAMFSYDFAISYAHEDFQTARELATFLGQRGFVVFLDRDFQHRLIGRQFSQTLPSIFGQETRYFLPLVSQHYATKPGAQFEWDAALRENQSRPESYIVPLRIDGTALYGLAADVAYIDLRACSLEDAAKALERKYEEEVGSLPHLHITHWIATFGTNIDELIEGNQLPADAPSLDHPHPYIALCDWLTPRLLRQLNATPHAPLSETEADERTGETLSVRVQFRWDPSTSELRLWPTDPWWELLELAPYAEIYP